MDEIAIRLPPRRPIMPGMNARNVRKTPSPYTPHGIKGGGEGGRMMAPAAINAAVNDALAPLGVRLTELPMTPERILAALRAAGHAG